jgi:glycosyltransferase involved in cell wall biosynthesis
LRLARAGGCSTKGGLGVDVCRMKIAVISQIRADSPKAHAINVFKTAGGFERLGHSVTVYCLEGGGQVEPGAAYGECGLRWRFAPEGLDAQGFGRWAADVAKADGAEFVYGRNFWGPLLTAEGGLASVVESHAHAGVENPMLDRVLAMTRGCEAMRGVITIGKVLADDFVRRGAEPSRVHVVADGVDFELFDGAIGREYEGSGPHVVYTGHLYDYKGIPTVLEAAERLGGAQFHLVGGLVEDIDRTRNRIGRMGLGNVRLHGWVEHGRIGPWTKGADVLLLPQSASEASKDWTSPVKLGEYLASGAEMVVSRIPALVEVLDGEPVVWFEPDDAGSLARAVEVALGRVGDEAGRARRRELARGLSYAARAGRILEAAGFESAKVAA